MPAIRHPLLATAARRYFYSGWAFLIPYLAAYLLYYITGWPVNPVEAAGEGVSSSPLTPLAPYTSYSLIPSLLHLYWSLHALHLILAAIALLSWWTENSAQYVRRASDPRSAPYSSYRLHLLTRIAPWAILALLFYIPGVYLEWPSDPWEHLRRINEWRILDTVGTHSSWHKSSYFIPYSFLSWCMGLRQIFWLDFYYTGICLILCWQYYRFSRACGLGERASMVFVIIQALLSGNNIFSFYRYYGISTSIYAQLGTVALTRIVLELLQQKEASGPLRRTGGSHPIFHLCRPGAVLLLVTLSAFSHVQGLIIAGLGIASLIAWRAIQWKRTAIYWLVAGIIGLNVACVAWWPKHPLIDSVYVSAGWLNCWYGFNFFTWASPAANRFTQVLGIFGIINLAMGFVLLRKNHVVGWLTVGPMIGLSLPCVAIAFANAIAPSNPEEIVAFSRLLFAIPSGLALALLAQKNSIQVPMIASLKQLVTRLSGVRLGPQTGYVLLILCLSGATILPAAAPYFNRFWHLMSHTPDDLTLLPIWKGAASLGNKRSPADPRVITMSQPGFILDLQQTGHAFVAYRHYARSARSPLDDLTALAEFIGDPNTKHASHVLLFDQDVFFSPASTAALYSEHWPPQESALVTAGTSEMKLLISKVGLQQQANPTGILFLAKRTKETQNANDKP